MNAALEAACRYRDLHLAVVPVTGKRPLIPWKERPAEPPMLGELLKWWDRWPNASVGVIIGPRLAVIDVDEHGDVSGLDSLHELEREHGELPDSWRDLSPSGGLHHWFSVPEGSEIRPAKLSDGVHLRTGRLILAMPPAPGREWEFAPGEYELVALPDHIARLAAPSSNGAAPVVVPERIPVGERHETFKSLAASLRRRGLRRAAILAALRETNREQAEHPAGERKVTEQELEDIAAWADALEGDSIIRAERGKAEPEPPAPQREDAPPLPVILDGLEEFIRRFVVLGRHELVALVLWIAHTHAFGGAHCTPYLALSSAAKRAGKTRAFEVIEPLVRKPWRALAASEAALFRKLDRDGPTLMLDEADTIFNGSVERYEPLRAILNAGNRPGVTVPRCVGQAHELREFAVYAPKALAGIDASKWPDTILDRSIRIEMRRAAKGERPEKFYRRFIEPEAEHLRAELEAWAATAIEELRRARPSGLEVLNDRAGEAWEPLFAIADMAAGDWPKRARKAAGVLSPELDDDSIGILVLAALRRLLAGKDELTTSEICEKLNADDELPFGGWREGDGIDGRGLARLLRPFGVRPKNLNLGGEERPKGYRREELADAFGRWL